MTVTVPTDGSGVQHAFSLTPLVGRAVAAPGSPLDLPRRFGAFGTLAAGEDASGQVPPPKGCEHVGCLLSDAPAMTYGEGLLLSASAAQYSSGTVRLRFAVFLGFLAHVAHADH